MQDRELVSEASKIDKIENNWKNIMIGLQPSEDRSELFVFQNMVL